MAFKNFIPAASSGRKITSIVRVFYISILLILNKLK